MGQVLLKASPDEFYTPSAADGSYKIYVDTGKYKVAPIFPKYALSCSPASHTASFTSTTSQGDTGVNFAMYMADVTDVGVDIVATSSPVPGRASRYYITYTNEGTRSASGNVRFINDPASKYKRSNPVYSSKSGDTLTWTYSNLAPGVSDNSG